MEGCFPSGCENQSYIEPQFNSDLLLKPGGSTFPLQCLAGMVCGACETNAREDFAISRDLVAWGHFMC